MIGNIALTNQVVKPFVDYLSRSDHFRLISNARNSFEGWIKWELVAFIAQTFPFARNGGSVHRERVGVETRVNLSFDTHGGGKRQKLVDVWLVENEAGDDYHYLELKVIFDNHNLEKQAFSAGADLLYLASMTPDLRAVSVGSLAILIGEDGTTPHLAETTSSIMRCGMTPLTVETSTIWELGRRSWSIYSEADWRVAHAQLKEAVAAEEREIS